MNNFSEDQATVLMNHIKFMLNTKNFEFVIYFLKTYDINDSNISRISSYAINSNSSLYNKYVRFKSIEQLQDYINNCFNSATDFFNSCFTFQDAQTDLSENTDPFAKSFEYFKQHFENKLASDFEDNMCSWFKQRHITFFNFVYNKENKNDIELITNRSYDSNVKFYFDYLTDAEKTYFRNAYKYSLIFSNDSTTQVEQNLSSALIHYRFDFHNFERVYDTIRNYEYCITNFLLPSLEEFKIIKNGKNNQFTTALKDCINKIINQFTSKKIQFDILNSETNEQFRLEYINEIIQRDDEKTKSILLKMFPEKTNNMLITTFNCKATCYFVNPISMQVKKTFMHNLSNYFINNNIQPESYKLIEDGLSKPATGISITFRCSNFERIGINPIKFMIPKLGMNA